MKRVSRQFNEKALVADISYEPNSPSSFILELKMPKGFKAAPGQFVVLEPLSGQAVMPRPFSIIGQRGDVIAIMIKVVGENTQLYSQLKIGNRVMTSGPKGSPINIGCQKKFILVGGGIDSAALIFLAQKLKRLKKEFSILIGAKTREDLHGAWMLRDFDIQTIVEEGEEEKTGYATDLLFPLLKKDQGRSVIIACGPKPMLAKVAELAAEYRNDCQVVLEEIMACGTGSCKGCAIFGQDGSVKHVCTDGPAFFAKWIDWGKLLPQNPKPRVSGIDRPASLKVELLGKTPNHQKFFWIQWPVLNDSGCLSIEALENGSVDPTYFGALVTKGVTLNPKTGNKGPRVCETASGMINSIGLENLGLEDFIAKELPRWLAFKKPVIANISGYSVNDYAQLAKRLADTEIAGLEVNISCPNISGGGAIFGTDPEIAARITDKIVKAAPGKIIVVKLTPNVTDIVKIGRSVAEAGADIISLVNTFLAMDIDVASRRPKIGMIMGGLSGPAITPIALRMIYQLRQAKLGVPIIGMGGIDSATTAAKFIMAGADSVAIGTGSFGRPNLAKEICRGLEKIIKAHGFNSIHELTASMIIN